MTSLASFDEEIARIRAELNAAKDDFAQMRAAFEAGPDRPDGDSYGPRWTIGEQQQWAEDLAEAQTAVNLEANRLRMLRQERRRLARKGTDHD